MCGEPETEFTPNAYEQERSTNKLTKKLITILLYIPQRYGQLLKLLVVHF